MIIELELRQQIAGALSGVVSLRDLYAWLMARSWNMHRDSSPEAVELAANVEELFFDRSNGDLDEPALRHALSSLLNNVVMDVPMGDAQVTIRKRTATSFPVWLPNRITSAVAKLPQYVHASTNATALELARQV